MSSATNTRIFKADEMMDIMHVQENTVKYIVDDVSVPMMRTPKGGHDT